MQMQKQQSEKTQTAVEFENPFERLLGGGFTPAAPALDPAFASLLDGTVQLHKAPPKARKVKEILGEVEVVVQFELEQVQEFCAICFKPSCDCRPRITISMRRKELRKVTKQVVVATEIVWE